MAKNVTNYLKLNKESKAAQPEGINSGSISKDLPYFTAISKKYLP